MSAQEPWDDNPGWSNSTGGSAPTDGSSKVRAEYRTDSALIGATSNMPWTYNPDVQPDPVLYHPLDLTDPQFPTIVEDGIYAVSVSVRAEDWPGHDNADFLGVEMGAYLSLDDAGFGWIVGATAGLGPVVALGLTRHGALSVSNTVWLPAGAVIALYARHTVLGEDLPFTMFATVQKF